MRNQASFFDVNDMLSAPATIVRETHEQREARKPQYIKHFRACTRVQMNTPKINFLFIFQGFLRDYVRKTLYFSYKGNGSPVVKVIYLTSRPYLDAVVDMIHYYANSPKVTSLYRVKLMKLLWYADALSYKRRGHAISGMVYRALPMGAVPIAYESIVDLSSIHCEEIDMGEGTGYKFLPTDNKEYPNISPEEQSVLDDIIQRFGNTPKAEIVEIMHQEDAYTETAPGDIIQFKYALTLSIS